MNLSLKEKITTVQRTMIDDPLVKESFSARETDSLKALIRVALEVGDFIERDKEFKDKDKLAYNLDTVLSAVESFMTVAYTYNDFENKVKSRFSNEQQLSLERIVYTICDWLLDFEEENDFLKKCRLLLDIYKLELALVSICY